MKFFNKERLKLMGSKDIKKYLKYAFGEIILVVIGILIAVAINNWNQRKQLNNANAELNDSNASDKLVNLNSTYKIYLEEIKAVEHLIFTTITDNLKEIERTEEWYADFITDLICKNECIDYLKNNKQHILFNII